MPFGQACLSFCKIEINNCSFKTRATVHYKLYALTNRTQMIPSLRNTGKEESRKTRLLLFLFFENNNTVLCSDSFIFLWV